MFYFEKKKKQYLSQKRININIHKLYHKNFCIYPIYGDLQPFYLFF